ncbi:hypothetical protein GCM10011611_66930 [Aliidongia dinghuensis]|uniref:Porin n=1 Tax=Aliidongia dinghuensis TaxID=1867774 RepID=A0A8J2Z1A3_9PROT|nr:hypothetical protein GCM10011611_66930 [Aliidongia dinghuensis]
MIGNLGGFRTTLAKYGIGFSSIGEGTFAANTLGTPRTVPGQYTFFGTVAPCVSKFSACAGNQVYFGQKPSAVFISQTTVTFDTSRYGVPDGQIAVALGAGLSSWVGFFPTSASLNGLEWWQTAFNKKLDIEIGYFSNAYRYMGTQIGGNFANTFGPGSSVNILLGESYFATPGANFTFHADGNFYDKAGVGVSGVVSGKTGNPLYDEYSENRTGFKFSPPNTGTFFIDELGYRNRPQPGTLFTWVRGGGMYNTAEFQNLSSSNPATKIRGNEGAFLLADQQLWQQDRSSAASARRGIYAGLTYMGAPEKKTAITSYYEGRAYWVGPLASRPADMLSFVYFHQDYSKYLTNSLDNLNLVSGGTAPGGYSSANSYSISYLAHLIPGLYGQFGLNYTDNPASVRYRNEGSALLVQASLTTVF